MNVAAVEATEATLFFAAVADESAKVGGGGFGDTKLGRAVLAKLDEDENSRDEGQTVPNPGSHKVFPLGL